VLLASGLVALALAAVVALLAGTFSGAGGGSTHTRAASPPAVARPEVAGGGRRTPARAQPARAASFAVGLLTLHLVDRSRRVALPDGTLIPRTLTTFVRYPARGARGAGERTGATPARATGGFPLIVFGHGFAVTPAIYDPLMRAWARAGFVVAAPVFPLANAHAPGGPDEADLVNQPADMSFVISSMLAASGAGQGVLAGMVDPSRVAVAGQSDGGDTALAVAYDPRVRDPRVGAAVILSGAEIPFTSSFHFPDAGPALLATQGTADTINPPSMTEAFFAAAPRPKYLLWLTGAEHLPPYTDGQPWLGIVERVSIAFLQRYLEHRPIGVRRLQRLGSASGSSSLEAQP